MPQKDGTTAGETDARQVFHRLAFTWMDWGKRYGYFSSEEDAQAFYDEMCYMLARQMGAPNSPQWFNTGLYAVYGMKGPAQGHYFVDPDTGGGEEGHERLRAPAAARVPALARACVDPVRSCCHRFDRRGGLIGLEVYDGTDDGRGTTRVIAVAENGVKPVFRVVLKNGTTVEATGDHLVLASRERRGDSEGIIQEHSDREGDAERVPPYAEWVPVEELTPGMRLQLSTVSEVRSGVLAFACSERFPGKWLPALREEAVVCLEFAGLSGSMTSRP